MGQPILPSASIVSMPPSFPSGPASVVVVGHALAMALASLVEGVFATLAGVGGGLTFFDPSANPVLSFFLGGYGLLRVVSFLVGMLASLLVLLSANSLRQGHRRFVLVGALLSLITPFVLILVNFMTSFGCTMWYLPTLSAIPAAVVLFDAQSRLPPAPPREQW